MNFARRDECNRCKTPRSDGGGRGGGGGGHRSGGGELPMLQWFWNEVFIVFLNSRQHFASKTITNPSENYISLATSKYNTSMLKNWMEKILKTISLISRKYYSMKMLLNENVISFCNNPSSHLFTFFHASFFFSFYLQNVSRI